MMKESIGACVGVVAYGFYALGGGENNRTDQSSAFVFLAFFAGGAIIGHFFGSDTKD